MNPYLWSLHAEAVVLVPLLALAYALVLRGHPAQGWRIACFLGGLGLILVVFVTPIENLALHYLLAAHLLQNVALAEWSPALIVLGLPPAAAGAARKYAAIRALTNPLLARPFRLDAGASAAYLFAAFAFASPLGLLLALIPSAVYGFYVHAPRIWGWSPLTDQQIAGVTMAAEEAVVFFWAFAFYFVRFMRRDETALDLKHARWTR